MGSGCRDHFPPVRYKGSDKYLWNRLVGRILINRPEERVRLRYIDYLTYQLDWPKARLSSETMIGRAGRQSVKGHLTGERADLIGYDKQYEPQVLIECKSEAVKLDEKAAEQLASYNRALQAPFICLTNGSTDLWYRIDNRDLIPLDGSPFPVKSDLNQVRQNRSYWEERGFLGREPIFEDRTLDATLMTRFWSPDDSWNRRFIAVPHRTESLCLEQDYRVSPVGHEQEVAISFMADTIGKSWLIALLLDHNEAIALLVIPVGRENLNGKSSGFLITGRGKQSIMPAGILTGLEPDRLDRWIGKLPGHLCTFIQDKAKK